MTRDFVIPVLLCGGSGERLGLGPKASVEIAPGVPLLAVRLKQIRTVLSGPIYLFVSPTTEDACRKIVTERDYGQILWLRQEAPRGHGEVLAELRKLHWDRPLWLSNIDNLGALPRRENAAWQEYGSTLASLEVVPSVSTDVGGFVQRDGVIRSAYASEWISTNSWYLSPWATAIKLPTNDGECKLDALTEKTRVTLIPGSRAWLQPIKTQADLSAVRFEDIREQLGYDA